MLGAMLLLAEACNPRHTHRMNRGPLAHRKRCKRWDTPFDAHCLTFSCFKRQPFFHAPHICRWFFESLVASRLKRPFDLWAYVIMPEHVHVVLWPHEGTKISTILQSMKLSLARKVLIWAQRDNPELLALMADPRPNGDVSYRFWQRGGGYDRNLRGDRDVHEKIRYIHDNPVRRGLVARPEDWPWSSAKTYCDGADGPIHIDTDSIPTAVS